MDTDDSARKAHGRDRRRTPRIEVLSQFHGHSVTLGVPVTLLDISLGGFRIETSVVFPLGAIHEFRFTLGSGETIEVRARVLHCGLHTSPRGVLRYSAGLEFVNGPANAPQPDVLRLIEEIRSSAVFNLQ
ncbi:MAG TPA: PilZ domain-containing protein [Vicinamibacterales bacterium]